MKTIKFYLVLLFTACTLLVNAQTPEGYPANYARGPRFKALVYYTQLPASRRVLQETELR